VIAAIATGGKSGRWAVGGGLGGVPCSQRGRNTCHVWAYANSVCHVLGALDSCIPALHFHGNRHEATGINFQFAVAIFVTSAVEIYVILPPIHFGFSQKRKFL